ncbi:hypothetical protein ACMYSQ_009305 [Aspergillus niger]
MAETMVDLTINQIEELVQSTEGHSRMNVHRPASNQQSHIPTHTTQLNPTTNHPIYEIHPESTFKYHSHANTRKWHIPYYILHQPTPTTPCYTLHYNIIVSNEKEKNPGYNIPHQT